jgi:hypothetical protein
MDSRRAPLRSWVPSLAAGLVLLAVAAVWAGVDDPAPAAPRVLQAGCPAVLPGTSNALDDYADLVVWQGRSYLTADGVPGEPAAHSPVPATLRRGPAVTTVGCSLGDASVTDGQRLAPGPWPDGTATGLPSGTTLFALRGADPACVLGAERDSEVVAYVAVDLEGDWTPLC